MFITLAIVMGCPQPVPQQQSPLTILIQGQQPLTPTMLAVASSQEQD